MTHSESILEAAIGMTTINSLLEVDEEMCQNLNAHDLMAEVCLAGYCAGVSRVSGY